MQVDEESCPVCFAPMETSLNVMPPPNCTRAQLEGICVPLCENGHIFHLGCVEGIVRHSSDMQGDDEDATTVESRLQCPTCRNRFRFPLAQISVDCSDQELRNLGAHLWGSLARANIRSSNDRSVQDGVSGVGDSSASRRAAATGSYGPARDVPSSRCVEIAFRLSEQCHPAWLVLGQSGGGVVASDGLAPAGAAGPAQPQHYTPQQCFVRCLELDPFCATAWLALGKAGGDVVVSREHLDKSQCFVRCVSVEPEMWSGWLELGRLGGGVVADENFSAQQCLLKCVEIEPKSRLGWLELGRAGGGTVLGSTPADDGQPRQSFDKKQCFLKCIEIEPRFQLAWIELGRAGGGTVNGEDFDPRRCFESCLQISSRFKWAWRELGGVGGGVVQGVRYSKEECLAQANAE